jgi:cytochrome c
MLRWTVIAAAAMAGAASAGDLRTLVGHGGPIMDVAVSPDGAAALTASFDNSVGLWDLGSGQARWLDGHEAAVKAAIFLPGGDAASAGDDFVIEVWDLTTGAARLRLTGHQGQIAGLAASPDGRLLASAGWDGAVGLWDLTDGRMIALMRGHDAPVNDVAFAADGRLVYSAAADGTIRLWDVETRAVKRIVLRHGFGVTRLLLNEDAGWMIYGAVDGGTRVVSLADGAVLADLTLDRRPILALAASRDMTRIAVGDGEGYIMILNAADWSVTRDFRAAQRGPIWALAFSGDGADLLVGGIDDAVYVWPIVGENDGPQMGMQQRSFHIAPEKMANGERQFARKCSICHSLTDDGMRRAGPSLAGLFGRRAGTLDGYNYSDAVADSDVIWTEDTIDQLFDLGPERYLPGTKMPMQRIVKPADRADLIEFLRGGAKH